MQIELAALQIERAAMQIELAAVQIELAAMQIELAAMQIELAGVQSELAGMQIELVAMQIELAAVQIELAALQIESARRQNPPGDSGARPVLRRFQAIFRAAKGAIPQTTTHPARPFRRVDIHTVGRPFFHGFGQCAHKSASLKRKIAGESKKISAGPKKMGIRVPSGYGAFFGESGPP